MKDLQLTIRNISIVKTPYGNDLLIKQVGIYDKDGKFIRNATINESLVNELKKRMLK
jgi:hypothetical protein